MAECVVCTRFTNKNKCAQCFQAYCSPECYKHHKDTAQCLTKEKVLDTYTKDNNKNSVPSVYEPFKTEDTAFEDEHRQLVPNSEDSFDHLPDNSENVVLTKEEIEKIFIRKSLAFLKMMSEKDYNTYNVKECELIMDRKRKVDKFERIYGPTSILLGIPKILPESPRASSSCNIKEPVQNSKEHLPLNSSNAIRTIEEKAMCRARKSVAFLNNILQIRSKITKEEKNMIRHHKHIVSRFESIFGPPKVILGMSLLFSVSSDASSCSKDDQPTTSKNVKTLPSSECNLLKAAVIDRTHSNGEISVDLWQLFEDRLLDEIANGSKDESKNIIFHGSECLKGVRVVNCGNWKTFLLLKSVVEKCGDLSPRASLDVIDVNIVTVWIPPPIKSAETVLSVLSNQNENLDTSQWQMITTLACKDNKGADFRFAIDKESLRVLRKIGGIVSYGLGHIRFCLPKFDEPLD